MIPIVDTLSQDSEFMSTISVNSNITSLQLPQSKLSILLSGFAPR